MAGKPSTGFITHPGYEHLKWNATIQEIQPQDVFSFTWHPYAIEPAVDYSKESPTLVEFKFVKSEKGTKVILTESGFHRIPDHRRAEAYKMNKQGWEIQMKNIAHFVETT